MKPEASFTICGRVTREPERFFYSLTDESKFKVMLYLEVTDQLPNGITRSRLFDIEFYDGTKLAAERAHVGQIVRVDGYLNWYPYEKDSGKKGTIRALVGTSIMKEMSRQRQDPNNPDTEEPNTTY